MKTDHSIELRYIAAKETSTECQAVLTAEILESLLRDRGKGQWAHVVLGVGVGEFAAGGEGEGEIGEEVTTSSIIDRWIRQ